MSIAIIVAIAFALFGLYGWLVKSGRDAAAAFFQLLISCILVLLAWGAFLKGETAFAEGLGFIASGSCMYAMYVAGGRRASGLGLVSGLAGLSGLAMLAGSYWGGVIYSMAVYACLVLALLSVVILLKSSWSKGDR